jgi:hypothetical protein
MSFKEKKKLGDLKRSRIRKRNREAKKDNSKQLRLNFGESNNA